MATWGEVSRVAMALPGVTASAYDNRFPRWQVRDKTFLWERPLRPKDLVELGLENQPGPVLGARVLDEGVKQALIQDDPDVLFTTSHFDGYPAVLVRLDALDEAGLKELATEAWLARAPKKLAREYLEGAS